MRIDRRGFTAGLLAASALAGRGRIATAQAQELVFATGTRVREDTNPQIDVFLDNAWWEKNSQAMIERSQALIQS